MTIMMAMCMDCVHYTVIDEFDSAHKCLAFPDGIPDAILTGEHDHREPYPGDNGIRFEPIQDTDA